jgi:hypothetical protein
MSEKSIPPYVRAFGLFSVQGASLGRFLLAVFFGAVLFTPLPSHGQIVTDEPIVESRSPAKALAMSLAVPGLGHRYVQQGHWRGAATTYAVADAALWLGLAGTVWKQNHVVNSYQTLAASRALANADNQSRRFLLLMASFRSSEEYREVLLRNRQWDQLSWAERPENQWHWVAEADFQRYRVLREEGESLGRRQLMIGTALAANRLLAGFSALRAANRSNRTTVQLSFGPPPPGSDLPSATMTITLSR